MTLPPIRPSGRAPGAPEPRGNVVPLSAGERQKIGQADIAAAPPDPSGIEEPSAAVARRRLSIEQRGIGFRRVPNAGEIARRRRLLLWTKWVLPVGALLLLASIAAWPELDRSMNAARVGLREAARIRLDSGRMLGARYRGLDAHDRPYMITADEAQQADGGAPATARNGSGSVRSGSSAGKSSSSGDRINLTRPIADTLSEGGSWVRITAENGVYMQHSQLLDLSRNVTLYRDDGIMMTSPVTDIDLRRGIIASNDWVHAEGPFGVLDAQGYLLSQRDGLAQFRGPGRLILNDDRIAHPAAAPVAGAAP